MSDAKARVLIATAALTQVQEAKNLLECALTNVKALGLASPFTVQKLKDAERNANMAVLTITGMVNQLATALELVGKMTVADKSSTELVGLPLGRLVVDDPDGPASIPDVKRKQKIPTVCGKAIGPDYEHTGLTCHRAPKHIGKCRPTR